MPTTTPVSTYRVTTDPVLLAAGVWLAQRRAAAGHHRESAARSTRMSLVALTTLEVGSSWLSETHYRAYLAALHLDPQVVSAALALREDAMRTPAERRRAGTVTGRQKGVFDGHDSWRARVAALDEAADAVTILSTLLAVPDLLATDDYHQALHNDNRLCSAPRELPARVMARSAAYISVEALDRPLHPSRESRRIMADQVLRLQDLSRSGLRLRLLPVQAPVPAARFITEYRVRLPEHRTGGRLVACGEQTGTGAYYYTRAEYRTVTDLMETAEQAALGVEDSGAYLARRLAELRSSTSSAPRELVAVSGGRSKAGMDSSHPLTSATRPRNGTTTLGTTPVADSATTSTNQGTETR